MSNEKKKCWTAKEFADAYAYNYKTVLQWLKDGKIPGGFRFGRDWRIDRETFLASTVTEDAATA